MAHTIAKTIILDSSREAVVHYTLISDGTSGELNKQIILDPMTDLITLPYNQMDQSNFIKQQPSFSVLEFWFNFQSFSALWQYDNGVNPQTIWQLSQTSGDSHYDISSVTGIKDRTGLYGTGRMILTTQGFGSSSTFGENISFIPTGNLLIRVKKYYSPRYVTNTRMDQVNNAPYIGSPGEAGVLPSPFINP
jgi:hypothetical protein